MKRINFDHLACSPILPEAKEAMLPFLAERMGNPLSWHVFGEDSAQAVETARQYVASLIAARPEEIVFTSCGSESNNFAIKGIAKAYSKKGKHIIASPIEHHSVLHPLKDLEKNGYEISWLTVDGVGMVNPEEVSTLIREDTVLITVTSASNEIGTLEPIQKIGTIARQKDIIFHTDAAAGVGFIPIDVQALNIDLLSLAGNSFYGPMAAVPYLSEREFVFPRSSQVESRRKVCGLAHIMWPVLWEWGSQLKRPKKILQYGQST
jgi:cysteine desulfurase